MSINWDEIKDYKPKRDFMYYIRRWVISPLSTAKYWLRTHTIDRYHMIDIRTPEYDWGWIDRDYAILAANFNILKEFVEKERKGSFCLEIPEEAWAQDMVAYWTDHVARDQEMKSLYDWWTKGRWEDHKTFDEAGANFTYEDMENLELIDQSNLHRLINIRQGLWT